jgi:Bacterial regulatory proteins, luxR family
MFREAGLGLWRPAAMTIVELEVLQMLAVGQSNQAIADEFVVTLDTVKNTSAMFSASSARPTAPRPSPGPGNSASSPDASTS